MVLPSRVNPSTLTCAVTTSILLFCRLAAAEANEAAISTAREIAKEGLAAYDAGRYEEANEKLSRGLEVVGVPTLALFTARANVKLGKLVRACELYLLATRLDAKGPTESVQVRAQEEAAAERGELLPRIPRLTIVLQGDDLEGVEVLLDGQPVPKALLGTAQLVNPGHRNIFAKRGDEQVSAEVDLAEKEHKTTILRFMPPDTATANDAPSVETKTDAVSSTQLQPAAPKPESSESSNTWRSLGWIGVGVGGAALAFGAITGGIALSEHARLRDGGCDARDHCFSDQQDDVDRYNGLRTLSSVGFVAGGVLATAGITLLFTSPKSSPTNTGLVLRPNTISFVGGF